MRQFSYITVRQLLKILEDKGVKISRSTLYKLEDRGVIMSHRSSGNWRVYSPGDVNAIVQAIKEDYGLVERPAELTN